MAEPRQKNLVERLADVGEGAIQRLGSAPGGDKVVSTLGTMRDRMDELQRRVRGLEDVEKRVEALERRVDKLEGKPERPAASSAEGKEAESTATSRASQQPKAAESKPASEPKASGSS
jgi:TolA-binding protein